MHPAMNDDRSMAQKIQTLLTDDLDPELKATETIAFGLAGASYEIDLNDEHSSQMREAFGPFITAARKVGGRPAVRRAAKQVGDKATASTRESDGPDPSAVRAWAKEHDIAVSERGRIKGSVVAQFIEATS